MPSTLVLALPTAVILAQAAAAPAPSGGTQQTTQPTQATGGVTQPSAQQPTNQPTQPTQPSGRPPQQGAGAVDVVDTRTTREENSARDPRAEVDTRTTRDEQFDPRAARTDREQADRARVQRVQQNLGPVGLRVPLTDPDGRPIETGGVDYILHGIVIEGYNTNVVQSQEVIGGPVTRHPAMFTGIELTGTRRSWITEEDPVEVTLQFRGQHYVSIDGFEQPADGTVLASAAGTYGVHPRGVFSARVFGTISTLNGSRLSDGPLFQVSPGTLQRTFTIFGARTNFDWAFSEGWRTRYGADVTASTTLHDQPFETGDPPRRFRVEHRGLDFVQPGFDATVLRDFDWRNTGFATLRYSPLITTFLVDFTQQPPEFNGSATIHTGELVGGLTHQFSEPLHTTTSIGAVVATPPPADPDRRWIISPRVGQELAYVKPLWSLGANVGYTYGSFNPRLGFGPTITANLLFQGQPWHRGNLSRITILGNVGTARAAFRADADTLSRLTFIVGGAQVRYAVTDLIGIIGGYDLRFTKFEGFGASPDFVRHVFFLGVSAYWATDHSVPTLQTFVPPLQGG
jgi:hypothetical protein